MIDVSDVLACFNVTHVPDYLVIPQLGDDKISLGVRIRIGRVGDLERELGQGEPQTSRQLQMQREVVEAYP